MKNLNPIKNQNEISIILIGIGPVGKTTIIQRYIDNSFKDSFIASAGIDIKIKKVIMEYGTEFKVKISDTEVKNDLRVLLLILKKKRWYNNNLFYYW